MLVQVAYFSFFPLSTQFSLPSPPQKREKIQSDRASEEMKSCELCKFPARMCCESDQASLCWDCDAKVHSANFLVARHARSLLCHVCQSVTAWSASGQKLGPTVSVCESCVDGCDRVKDEDGGAEERESQGGNDDDEIDSGSNYGEHSDSEDEEEDADEDDAVGDDDDDDELSGDDEDGDNQVVPWSSTTPSPPPATSSSSEESFCSFANGSRGVSLKRVREDDTDLCFNRDYGCSYSRCTSTAAAVASGSDLGDAAFVDSLRPLKNRRIETSRCSQVKPGPSGSRSASILESLKGFHQQDLTSGENASAAIIGICKLSKNEGAVDMGSSESPQPSDPRERRP